MNTKILAQALRSKGRYGDTDLVHVNEQEKQLLKMAGGSGTINPHTGLQEFSSYFSGPRRGGFWSNLVDPFFGSDSGFHQQVVRPIGTAVAAGFSGPFAPLTVGGINQLEAAGQGKSFAQGAKEAAIGAALTYGGGLANNAASGAGGAAAGAVGSGASSAIGDAGNAAVTDALGQTASDATTQSILNSAGNATGSALDTPAAQSIGASLGYNPGASASLTGGYAAPSFAGGANLGSDAAGNALSSGAYNVGGDLAQQQLANDAAKQTIYRKLLATALKEGGAAATHRDPLQQYGPPPTFGANDVQQPRPMQANQQAPGNQYNDLIYGYNPNAT